jgi:stage V sporulation protein D (sporulation-specific penicillin-binding protein)
MRASTGIVTRKRTVYVWAAVSFLLFLLMGRLAFVQLYRGALYRERALDQRLRPVPVDAKRGTIYDAQGRELAVSISADSVYAIPAEVTKPGNRLTAHEVAASLAGILGTDEAKLYRQITKRTSSVWVARKVPHSAVQKIRDADLPGIGVSERSQRFYPKGELACHVLGLAGIDNQGLEGLEVYYDNYLKGAPGRVLAERDGKGRQIPEGLSRYVPAHDGDNLYLTIDEVAQYVAERELDKAMAATKAVKGVAILIDPSTGGIMALVNRPGYDPNNFGDYPSANRRNTALADSYEPGSTFKAVTAAASLEEGVVRPSDTFFDPGFIVVAGRRLNCWKAGGHGSETFVQAVQNSCNPVFVKLATSLGRDKFYQYIKAFGFGQKTGIDFPGEAPGLLSPLQAVGPVELGTIGFGQGVSVTPLQMVTGLSVIANGGYLITPHLLKSVKSATGDVVKEIKGERVRQVISEATAHELSEILASVVSVGSGKAASVPGYRIAGKTGTAQIPDKGRYGNKVVASFIGFAPVDHPRFVGIVALYEPDTPVTFGSVLAAPVFGAIAKDVLRYLNVKPTEPVTTGGLTETATGAPTVDLPAMLTVPDVRNLPVSDALSTLEALGLKGQPTGSSGLVYSQVPSPSSPLARGGVVALDTNLPKGHSPRDGEVTVPDLVGRSVKEAAGVLARIGLRLQLKGTGISDKQDPAPGAKVKLGDKVSIHFSEPPVPKMPDTPSETLGTSADAQGTGVADDGAAPSAAAVSAGASPGAGYVVPAGLHP